MVKAGITIQALRVRALRLPMSEPHRTAGGTVTESPMVLTDLVTDQGVVGHSLIFTYNALALRPTATLVQNLEPLVVGQPLAPRALNQMLAQRFRLLGAQGLTGMAMAAIDMAAWDALAKVHGVPLYRLLGGESRFGASLRRHRFRWSHRIGPRGRAMGAARDHRREGEDRLSKHRGRS